MKFNFRKIVAVLATTAMLGSTLGFAAAAWPSPFVSSGAGDAAMVVGASAPGTTDMAAATQIAAALEKSITTTSGTISGEGDKQLISEKGTAAVSLNFSYANLTSVWATTITDDNLPTLLKDGTYQNDENSEFPYTQKINLGDSIKFTHFSDSDYKDKTPTLGFKVNSGTTILTYTLDWTTDPESDVSSGDLADIETTDITILGKSYYVLDADNSTLDLTLLDTAEGKIISQNEVVPFTVGSKTYQVSLAYVGSTTTRVTVDGETTNSLSAGGTYKLGDGTYVGIKDIMYDSKDTGISQVELSLGSGKLELINSAGTVELNDITIDDLNCSVIRGTHSSGKEKLSKLVIVWKLDDETFLTPDMEMEMPGFKAVKLSTTGVAIPGEEKTTVTYGSNDYIELKTTIKDGSINLPILYATSGTGNFSGVGKASDELLATSNTSTLVYNAASGVNDGFIASWANTRDFESYYLSATVSRDSTGERTNRTTIKNKLTGAEICKNIGPSDTCTVGNVVLTASSVDYTDSSTRSATFTINSGGSFSTLYTDKGLKVYLPFIAAGEDSTTKGAMNFTNATGGFAGHTWSSAYLYMSEADVDGNLGAGPTFYITLNDNSDKVQASDVTGDGTALETASGSKIWESYMASDLATKFLLNSPGGTSQADVEITYHGARVSPAVYITAPSVSAVGSSTLKTYTDAEVAANKDSVKDKNLIVVGGSCINTVAASLLESSSPLCGEDFTSASGVGAGHYIVKVFNSPYAASGKVAMLVAGYDAADTTAAGAYVAAGNFADTTVGKSVIGPVVASP